MTKHKYIAQKEAAQILGVSLPHLNYMIKTKKVRSTMRFNRIVIWNDFNLIIRKNVKK